MACQFANRLRWLIVLITLGDRVEHPEDVVVLEVYNENWVRKDEFLGQTQLAVSDFGTLGCPCNKCTKHDLTYCIASIAAGGVEEDRWLKLWEKPAPIDGRRASLGIETSVFSSNGTASTETLDAQTTPANPVVPAVATITLEPVPSSVTTSDSAAKVADPSGTNTLTVTPMVPTDKLTPRGSPTAVANTASPAAKTAALTSDPQYRAASRPYDHTVFRGFIHVKIMFNSVDPLLFRSAANANANLSSSNQTGRDSPSSRSRSQVMHDINPSLFGSAALLTT